MPLSNINAPNKPGVYLMKNNLNQILYVGKAKDLKKRISQYKKNDVRKTIQILLPQISKIDIIVVETEKEALILENVLIKKHKPKYNILLKDDKTYVCLIISNHKWPTIKLTRNKKQSSRENIFGPYTNAKAAKAVLDIILKIFPIRQCSDNEFINRSRHCILYEIKKCPAPCVKKCTKEDYMQNIEMIKKFLQGRNKEIIVDFKDKMRKASDELEFEKAQSFLQKIKDIKHITEKQNIVIKNSKILDAVGIYTKEKEIIFSILYFRDYKLIDSIYFIFEKPLSSKEEALSSFLMQHYNLKEKIPKRILLPIHLEEKKEINALLNKIKKQKTLITTPQKGKNKDLIKMANKNAFFFFKKQTQIKKEIEGTLFNIQKKLKLINYPKIIECIDASNLNSKNATVGVIRFVNGEKDFSQTRVFKIKTSSKSDIGFIKEALVRHFSHNPIIDLLIVDGGKQQLTTALNTIRKDLNISNIDIISIKKDQAKHTKGLTQEIIFLESKESVKFLKTSKELLLLQKIRDEAHNTAINFHRKLLKKASLSPSTLLKIKGIGEKKEKMLLQRFKSLKQIKSTTEKELEKIKILTKKDVKNILKL